MTAQLHNLNKTGHDFLILLLYKTSNVMQKQSKRDRKGNTSRTSSQGRKLSSRPKKNKKGNPDINENTKNLVGEEKPKKKRIVKGL